MLTKQVVLCINPFMKILHNFGKYTSVPQSYCQPKKKGNMYMHFLLIIINWRGLKEYIMHAMYTRK